jgi:alpha-L-rhamnosidase
VSYADEQLLAEHYPAAKRWVDYVAAHNPDGIWSRARGVNDWGDWLSAGPATPKELGATAFFAHSADLVARMADALGKPQDAAKYQALFTHIKQAFNRKYVAVDGSIAGAPGGEDGERAQGNYALALQFGLLDERVKPAAMAHLLRAIQLADSHPTIGFWSTAGLLLALTDNGQNAVAARMLALSTPPSWGYMADHGTTFWEAFDADKRNLSLNHWTHSSVGEWLWRDVAGLNPDPAHPGYEQFSVRPQPSAEVSWCRASYDSVRGPISLGWRQAQKDFTLDLTVPVTSTALVYLPASSPERVTENGRPITETAGVSWLRQAGKTAVLQVQSGAYHFKVAL